MAPSLQALGFKKANFFDITVKSKVASRSYANRANQELQAAIMALHLTSLSLVNNDFMLTDCQDMIPKNDAGNLTELRCSFLCQKSRMAARGTFWKLD